MCNVFLKRIKKPGILKFAYYPDFQKEKSEKKLFKIVHTLVTISGAPSS